MNAIVVATQSHILPVSQIGNGLQTSKHALLAVGEVLYRNSAFGEDRGHSEIQLPMESA